MKASVWTVRIGHHWAEVVVPGHKSDFSKKDICRMVSGKRFFGFTEKIDLLGAIASKSGLKGNARKDVTLTWLTNAWLSVEIGTIKKPTPMIVGASWANGFNTGVVDDE